MSSEYPFMDEIPDFVMEADATEDPAEFNITLPEVTIKCGKGLVSQPFTTKKGQEMVEIKIPNTDPDDKHSWESFVMPANRVHDNQYGKGVWMKLPEEGTTRLSRAVCVGTDTAGKRVWKREYREVPNIDLKNLVEHYKARARDSVRGRLEEKKEQAAEKATAPSEHKNADLAW